MNLQGNSAGITGSVGLAGSANIGDRFAIFEAIRFTSGSLLLLKNT